MSPCAESFASTGGVKGKIYATNRFPEEAFAPPATTFPNPGMPTADPTVKLNKELSAAATAERETPSPGTKILAFTARGFASCS